MNQDMRSAATVDEESTDGAGRVAGRVAQFLLGIPLGLLQLGAVIGFTVTGATVTRGDWLVAVSGLVMSTACVVLAVRVYSSERARVVAFAVLAAQALFSLVKLAIYHESTSFVFLAIVAATATTLGIFHRARRA